MAHYMADDRQPARLTSGLARLLAPVPLLVFLGLFALGPALLLFASGVVSVGGAGGALKVLVDPLNVRAIQNSFLQGGLSAAGALVIGYPAGVFLGRYSFSGRSLLIAVLLVPFLLPSLVVVNGISSLVGSGGILSGILPGLGIFSRGIPGIVAVNVVFNAPIVMLFTTTGAESASPELEETVATLGGGPARRYLSVWGPPSWLGAAAGGLLTFLFSALAFAAPILVCGARCYTLEARVWALAQTLLDPAAAAVLALWMVALLVAPTAIYLELARRLRRQAQGRRARQKPIAWRAPFTGPLLAVTAVFAAFVVLLLAAILARSVVPLRSNLPIGSSWTALFGPGVSAAVGISTVGALFNTAFYGIVSTGIVLLLGIGALFALPQGRRGQQLLGLLVFLPLLISPVVLSFALASFWRPVLGGESAVWFLIIVSQSVLAFPFVLQGLGVSLGRFGRGRREAAQILGSPPFFAFLDIDLPLARRGVLAAGLFALALSLGEFTATYFLATPAYTTLPVELYHLLSIRAVAPAQALAGLLVLFTGAVFGAIVLTEERVEL
jgi:thiamine transport system permease protein